MLTVTALTADGDRLVVHVDAGELVGGTTPEAADLVEVRLASDEPVELTATGPLVAPSLEPDTTAAATVADALTRYMLGVRLVGVDGDELEAPAEVTSGDGLADELEDAVVTY